MGCVGFAEGRYEGDKGAVDGNPVDGRKEGNIEIDDKEGTFVGVKLTSGLREGTEEAMNGR